MMQELPICGCGGIWENNQDNKLIDISEKQRRMHWVHKK
ncbi:hypothetical protein MPF_1759 [Methanohalophilus portucalensis FDF-1]|uniref:Uncharacterized protein n=1 Tax=Methanohalophilus portucalensis FDF-1 TaxID=523843 RepID=A0A1L9C2F1_9EURY|nr:hypothetical protein MPF_1759 [Methanohalophilus portucalensis FDF-1]